MKNWMNEWRKMLAVVLTVCLLGGCVTAVPADSGKTAGDTGKAGTEDPSKEGETSKTGETSLPGGNDTAPTVLLTVTYPVEPAETYPSEELLEAVQRFAAQTSADLLGGGGNMLYSPMSLYFALALAAEGTDGETLAQMRAFLGAAGIDDFAVQCGNLFRTLCRESEDKKTVLRIANSLWMQYGHDFKQEYLNNVRDNLFASLYEVDFSSRETGNVIGQWIADNTGGLLSYDFTPDPGRVLSILNTVWLKGAWADAFEESKTTDDVFTKADGSMVKVPFMQKYETFDIVYKGDGFIRAEMGIRGLGRMVFILPDEGKLPEDLMANAAGWNEVLHGGKAQKANISWFVPRYEGKNTIDLTTYLREKMPSAFSGADFSRMTAEDVAISGVVQKTRIIWDEEGVEAAAYTEIALNSTALPTEKPEEIEFRLDRPFLYGIQTYDGVDLFVGTVYDPAAGE